MWHLWQQECRGFVKRSWEALKLCFILIKRLKYQEHLMSSGIAVPRFRPLTARNSVCLEFGDQGRVREKTGKKRAPPPPHTHTRVSCLFPRYSRSLQTLPRSPHRSGVSPRGELGPRCPVRLLMETVTMTAGAELQAKPLHFTRQCASDKPNPDSFPSRSRQIYWRWVKQTQNPQIKQSA